METSITVWIRSHPTGLDCSSQCSRWLPDLKQHESFLAYICLLVAQGEPMCLYSLTQKSFFSLSLTHYHPKWCVPCDLTPGGLQWLHLSGHWFKVRKGLSCFEPCNWPVPKTPSCWYKSRSYEQPWGAGPVQSSPCSKKIFRRQELCYYLISPHLALDHAK